MISTAIFCLAINIFHESRGESEAGQYAVALVTLNRANAEHKPICSIVTAHKQFSWTTNGLKQVERNNKFVGYQLTESAIPKDMRSWNTAVKVAKYTLAGKVSDFTFGANHYYAFRKCTPYWQKQGVKTVVIGNHIFYKLA